MHANKNDRSRNQGKWKKKSFNRAWSTKIEQIQCFSYLSIPSHSSTTPARGDFNMRGRRSCPLLLCHVFCGKHMDCLVAFLHGIRGPFPLPVEEAPTSQRVRLWLSDDVLQRNGIYLHVFSQFVCYISFFFKFVFSQTSQADLLQTAFCICVCVWDFISQWWNLCVFRSCVWIYFFVLLL